MANGIDRKVPSWVFLALAPVSKACAAKVFGICSLGKSPVLPVCSKKNRSQPPSSSVASSSHLHNPEPVLVNTRVILHEQSRRKNGQPFSGSRFSGSRFFAHLCVTKRPHIEGRSFRGALRRERKNVKTARHDTTRHDTSRHDTTRHDTTRPCFCEGLHGIDHGSGEASNPTICQDRLRQGQTARKTHACEADETEWEGSVGCAGLNAPTCTCAHATNKEQ